MVQETVNEMNTEPELTKAEKKIASGYVDGLIGKEIADRYGISYNTVVRHTQNIYEKTGIRHSTNALVAWFLAKTYNLDLDELKRSLGAVALLFLVSFQIAATDFDNSFVRSSSARARRVEARRTSSRRNRREDDTYHLPMEG